MEKFTNFLQRHASWLLIFIISVIILIPTLAEIKTFLIIIISECLALLLSGIALFVYTKIDFTSAYYLGKNNENVSIIGSVFLGVHILIGLVVLGVYIAQFTN